MDLEHVQTLAIEIFQREGLFHMFKEHLDLPSLAVYGIRCHIVGY